MRSWHLVQKLCKFYQLIEKSQEGLKSKVILYLYDTEIDYVRDIHRGSAGKTVVVPKLPDEVKSELEAAGFASESKGRVDFEVYILYNNVGSFQGHYSGKLEMIGGSRPKYTGRFEELKDYQFIHLLLPEEYTRLITRCTIEEPGLNKKAELGAAFPFLTSATDLYGEYLRSVYSSASSQTKKSPVEILNLIECGESIPDFIQQKEELDAILVKENRAGVFAVEQGKLKIYDSRSKKKRRCLNGWMFGESSEPAKKKTSESPGEEKTYRNYEKIASQLSLANRIKLLLDESQTLLGTKYPPELVEFLVDIKRDMPLKILEHLKVLSANPEAIKSQPPEQLQKIKFLLTKGLRYVKLNEKFPSQVMAYGGRPDQIKAYTGPVMAIARIFQLT